MNMYSRPRVLLADQVADAPCRTPSPRSGWRGCRACARSRRSCASLRSPERAVGFTRNLGTTNSEMPLHALGRVRRARQHQVHDVLGQVVLAVGDEDLLPGDQVVVAVRRRRLRAHQRQVASPACGSVRFMVPVQVPATILPQVGLLQRVRAAQHAARGSRPGSAAGRARSDMFDAGPASPRPRWRRASAGPGRPIPRRTAARPSPPPRYCR